MINLRKFSEFQRLPGRIPWAAIRESNEAHLPPKYLSTGYLLDDPSRMGQKAVLAFLNNWHKRQEVGKDWPLKFLKPGKIETEGKDVGRAGEKILIGNQDEQGDQVPAGQDGGEKNPTADEDLSAIPNQVKTPMRKPFLESLSKETSYRKLIGLLELVDVGFFFFRKIIVNVFKHHSPFGRSSKLTLGPLIGATGVIPQLFSLLPFTAEAAPDLWLASSIGFRASLLQSRSIILQGTTAWKMSY